MRVPVEAYPRSNSAHASSRRTRPDPAAAGPDVLRIP